jgi:hypothetical protein
MEAHFRSLGECIMLRSNASGRSGAVFFIKDQVIDEELQNKGWQKKELHKSVNKNTLTVAIRNRRASRDTVLKISTALGIQPSALVDWERQKKAYGLSDADESRLKERLDALQPQPSRGSYGLISGRPMQDRKNVLCNPKIASRLVTLRRPPPLVECVRASSMFLPIDDSHKDHPFIPGTRYNHFFQLGAVIRLLPAGARRHVVAAYTRSPTIGLQQYTHTQGASILWGASYEFQDGRTKGGAAMDDWIEDVQNDPQRAAEVFIHGTPTMPAVFLEILKYKIDLRRWAPEIVPLAVVTNDQRAADGTGRVYTQYVFDLRLNVAAEGVCATLDEMAPKGLTLVHLAHDVRPEEVLAHSSDGKKRQNLMDIAVWNAIYNRDQRTVRVGTAILHRGFEIVSTAAKSHGKL